MHHVGGRRVPCLHPVTSHHRLGQPRRRMSFQARGCKVAALYGLVQPLVRVTARSSARRLIQLHVGVARRAPARALAATPHAVPHSMHQSSCLAAPPCCRQSLLLLPGSYPPAKAGTDGEVGCKVLLGVGRRAQERRDRKSVV